MHIRPTSCSTSSKYLLHGVSTAQHDSVKHRAKTTPGGKRYAHADQTAALAKQRVATARTVPAAGEAVPAAGAHKTQSETSTPNSGPQPGTERVGPPGSAPPRRAATGHTNEEPTNQHRGKKHGWPPTQSPPPLTATSSNITGGGGGSGGSGLSCGGGCARKPPKLKWAQHKRFGPPGSAPPRSRSATHMADATN